MYTMKIRNATIASILLTTLILIGCGNPGTSGSSGTSGIDYRVIMDKNVNSSEVKEFFIKNKISRHKKYLDIDDKNGIITNIDFKDACPPEYMPFGTNFIMNRELVFKIYGKPDKKINRTYLYYDLQLGIQFNSKDETIQDIGVYSIGLIKKLNESKKILRKADPSLRKNSIN